MGLFRRKAEPFQVEMPAGADIVGESNYQDTLSAIAGGRRDYGEAHPAIPVTVELKRDPKNHNDPNVVKVLIDGMLVGRLTREAAAGIQDVLRECEKRGLRAEVPVFIDGGTVDSDGIESSWGVKFAQPSGPGSPNSHSRDA